MNDQRKEQIRKDCENEARDMIVPYVTGTKWNNEELVGWITNIKSAERIKAEELIGASRAMLKEYDYQVGLGHIPYRRHEAEVLETALAKYHTP